MPRNLVNIDLVREYVTFGSYEKDDIQSVFVELSGDTGNGQTHLKTMSDIMCMYILERM